MLEKEDIQLLDNLGIQHQGMNIHQQMDFLCTLSAPLLDIKTETSEALHHALFKGMSNTLQRPLNTFWIAEQKKWMWTQAYRKLLTDALNHTLSFLLSWKDEQTTDYLAQCSELAQVIPGTHQNQRTNPISLDNMSDWLRSPHRSLLGQNEARYLPGMNMDVYGKFLPRLIAMTDLRGSYAFYSGFLEAYQGTVKRALATAAIIQHLQHGDEIPLAQALEAIGPEHPNNTYRPHWHWIADFHAYRGIIDPQRTRQFFEQYCQHMMTSSCASTRQQAQKLAIRLDVMCDDRSLTFNTHSKRAFLEHDMEIHL